MQSGAKITKKLMPVMGKCPNGKSRFKSRRFVTTFLLAVVSAIFFSWNVIHCVGEPVRTATFCNPLNLDYRFQLSLPSRREAADPTLVRYQGKYWLFASKSGGYWSSSDLVHWQRVTPTGLPLEEYAPTVEIIDGRMFYTAFNSKAVFTTDDPQMGVWTRVAKLNSYGDPALFADDDGRVYMYWGCSANGGIQAAELDPQNGFKVIKGPVTCFKGDYVHHGWEIRGDDNLVYPNGKHNLPSIEGSWMTKHDGIYYLQYAAPGTEYKSYGDGVYTSTNAMGPFVYAPYSPFSYKPTGFICGAGHSSILQDYQDHYWHISTMTISVRTKFERRVGLFPTGFTADGQMFCNTYLGDYPQFVPASVKNPEDNSPGWMLLSYRKPATASSMLKGFPVENAFDENIQTWWSAASGKPGEWLRVDLRKPCLIQAMQINFADQGATNLGLVSDDAYCYYVQVSTDGTNWQTCLDRDHNTLNLPHDYVQLERSVKARYVRLVNVHTPGASLFSISGFRIFGSGLGPAPARVKGVKAVRDAADPRRLHVSWQPVKNADFYIIRYGIARDRLFNNYQVYGTNQFDINSLNLGVAYCLTLDAVNDSGVTKGGKVLYLK